MVRHTAVHYGIPPADPTRREINGFGKALLPIGAKTPHDCKIFKEPLLFRGKRQHQKACVRGIDQFPPCMHIQCQLRRAERTILIIHFGIKREISAFRFSEHTQFLIQRRACAPLRKLRKAKRLFLQGSAGGFEPKIWHKCFKCRARPGGKPAVFPHANRCAGKRLQMPRGHLVPRYGKKAQRSCLA